ncbi:hypothetical protein DFJ77DRAFT_478836 [Powellomyces hirtus]|nr:hypothetical protein DFJ77DRAFT_478836 [Powellomyces hirtus]
MTAIVLVLILILIRGIGFCLPVRRCAIAFDCSVEYRVGRGVDGVVLFLRVFAVGCCCCGAAAAVERNAEP